MLTTAQIRSESIVQRHAATAYFLLAFTISWLGALVVAAPSLVRHQHVSGLTGILIFPAMLLGPLVSGIVMAGTVNGRDGVRALFQKMFHWRIRARWYAVLLIPPLLIVVVLSVLSRAFSPAFTPNHFWLGIAFGVPAGICEEIGWMGFAFPALHSRRSALATAVVLGLFWGAWHLPAINFLGASAPHGRHWFQFFLAFTFAMTAMRALLAWIYVNTRSLLLAQLMHISSTGALVIFSPPVTTLQEVMWYGIYGCMLWVLVIVIVARCGRDLQMKKVVNPKQGSG